MPMTQTTNIIASVYDPAGNLTVKSLLKQQSLTLREDLLCVCPAEGGADHINITE